MLSIVSVLHEELMERSGILIMNPRNLMPAVSVVNQEQLSYHSNFYLVIRVLKYL